jgi:hypothetical protein
LQPTAGSNNTSAYKQSAMRLIERPPVFKPGQGPAWDRRHGVPAKVGHGLLCRSPRPLPRSVRTPRNTALAPGCRVSLARRVHSCNWAPRPAEQTFDRQIFRSFARRNKPSGELAAEAISA